MALDCHGSFIEHVKTVALHMLSHGGLHSLEAARAVLVYASLVRCMHYVQDGGCKVAVGLTLAAENFTAELSSLILVSRHASPEAFVLPEPLPAARPVADLYAFGEDSVLAQRRLDGEARPPARIADGSLTDGLGARLTRARAEHRLHAGEGS